MKRIDAYLTGIAQSTFPDALIIVHDEETTDEKWVFKRKFGESCILGDDFKVARRALDQLIAATKASPE
jgi:hypothetical protein